MTGSCFDVWIGSAFAATPHRVLILGESWYGETEPLSAYVPRWAAKTVRDNTFSRIFNSASGMHTERAAAADRLKFWNTIAFYNLVPGSIGATRASRPTTKDLRAGVSLLPEVLSHVGPGCVWVLGQETACHAVPVLKSLGLRHQVTPHPTSYGLTAESLRASWDALLNVDAPNSG